MRFPCWKEQEDVAILDVPRDARGVGLAAGELLPVEPVGDSFLVEGIDDLVHEVARDDTAVGGDVILFRVTDEHLGHFFYKDKHLI